MSESAPIEFVLVTGATGFVGRSVVRKLLTRGLKPVCLVRSCRKLLSQHPDVDPDRFIAVVGSLEDSQALRKAVESSQAVIHLVGIILQRRLAGQTFERVHVEGTRAVVEAMERAGIKRLVHMSALGTRAGAASMYHQSKWAAEECVRASNLDWTILQPSLIHGPRGEFMRLMKQMMCGWAMPIIPYFGSGRARVQPVSVEDVAHCCVESLFRNETANTTIPLGGPMMYTWIELYNTCRALIPRAKRWKPLISLPVLLGGLAARLSGPPMALAERVIPGLGLFRFDVDQIKMSQEDKVCDHTIAERAFDMRMRSFEDELVGYADAIV